MYACPKDIGVFTLKCISDNSAPPLLRMNILYVTLAERLVESNDRVIEHGMLC